VKFVSRIQLLLVFGVVGALLMGGAPAACIAGEGASGEKVWAVQFDTGGVVDLYLLSEGGKIVSAFAIETNRNAPWFVESQGLTVAAGEHLQGNLTLKQGPDLSARMREGKITEKEADRLVAELALDLAVKDGRIAGAIKTMKPADSGLLGFTREMSRPSMAAICP